MATSPEDAGRDLFVTVRFSDGHKHRWRLPATQTADEALEELRQVVTSGQWFRLPNSTVAYSPYAIARVEIGEDESDGAQESIPRRLGEVVGEILDPDG